MTDTSKYKSVAVPIETWLVKKETDKRGKEKRN